VQVVAPPCAPRFNAMCSPGRVSMVGHGLGLAFFGESRSRGALFIEGPLRPAGEMGKKLKLLVGGTGTFGGGKVTWARDHGWGC